MSKKIYGITSLNSDGRVILKPVDTKDGNRVFESYYEDESESRKEKKRSNINSDTFGWVSSGDSFFLSQKPTNKTVPAGLYDIVSDMVNGVYLQQKYVKIDELYQLPDPITYEVLNDLETFWNSGDKYKKYGITQKRGIMLYGEPGTGKSSLLNIIIDKVISEYNGIAINLDSVDRFVSIVNNIRNIDPTQNIVAIIEDIDSFLQYNSTKTFLNLLDGNMQIDNIVYLATTNYIDSIEPRIKNRPSRFDRKYYVSFPNENSRRFFFENKIQDPVDREKIDLDKWVKDTNGMPFSHLKELIISVLIMGNDYEKTIRTLRTMTSKDTNDNNEKPRY